MSKKKWLLGCGSAFVGVSLLLCLGCGGMVWRYIDGGVNPLREIKHATLGESFVIKEHMNVDGDTEKSLVIDAINHGMQFEKGTLKPARDPKVNLRRLPTTYYHPDGPVGLVIGPTHWFRHNVHSDEADARLPASLVGMGACSNVFGSPWEQLSAAWSDPPIGAIMMNVGTLAGYARPMQTIDFYESNPAIVQLSIPKDGTKPKFTYIDDAKKRGAHVRVFEGPERATFEKQAPENYYRYIFIDTIRGHTNLVSENLITKEALQMYLKATTEDGVICFHTSSRDFELSKVIVAVAADQNLAHMTATNSPEDGHQKGHYHSNWVFVARKKESLDRLDTESRLIGRFHAARNKNLNHGGSVLGLMSEVPDRSLVFRDGESNSLAPVKRK